ncbi:MAG: HipA N-terminal domain-containing protein [Marinilabiliaceae bacterium]|nr:HipA N-terminal domain-containing protein [Marinilabiliaceae bacterium]
MRKAIVYVNNFEAGTFSELDFRKTYRFQYFDGYTGEAISLTMPVSKRTYEYSTFPSFFDGLLPEGHQLEGLLKIGKIDRNDLFSQLMAVGDDLVGNVTLKEVLQ